MTGEAFLAPTVILPTSSFTLPLISIPRIHRLHNTIGIADPDTHSRQKQPIHLRGQMLHFSHAVQMPHIELGASFCQRKMCANRGSAVNPSKSSNSRRDCANQRLIIRTHQIFLPFPPTNVRTTNPLVRRAKNSACRNPCTRRNPSPPNALAPKNPTNSKSCCPSTPSSDTPANRRR